MLTQAKESILDDSDCVHALGSKELILLSILGSILGFRVFLLFHNYCYTTRTTRILANDSLENSCVEVWRR